MHPQDFTFKDAEVQLYHDCNGDIVLKCRPARDSEGQIVDPKEQIPTIVSMDNYQAYRLAIGILQRLDVVDTRGSR